MKVCFVGDGHQDIYVNQLVKKINFVRQWSADRARICVSTTAPIHGLPSHSKAFDIEHLRLRHFIPQEKVSRTSADAVKYNEYPWNLRRFIIYKAAELGYDCIVWTDCDVTPTCSFDEFIDIVSDLDENVTYTTSSLWPFLDAPPNQAYLFENIDKPIQDLSISVDKRGIVARDGPTAIYRMTPDKTKELITKWDKLAQYSYESGHVWGNAPNFFISNEAVATAWAGIKVEVLPRNIFRVEHDLINRY